MMMNPLEEMLLEARQADALRERQQEALRSLAEDGAGTRSNGARALLGGWLVRAGLWLDPRAPERLSSRVDTGKAGQQA